MTSRSDKPGVAIIGMSCRFPGASDADAFWQNLSAGVESIVRLTDAELSAAGVSPDALENPAYVKAASVLDDIDAFDAPFFEYSPHEAQIIDPQQRLLLEVAWEAFEDAGYRPGGATGVFVGCGGVVSSYLVDRLLASPELPGYTGSLSHLGNDKDFASTRISYKLNLTGPSINVQTACSTSLVAVHLACQSVLSGECDTAIAGASAIRVPQRIGYHSIKGGILSPDGHCRAFDADAQGTIFGSGVGVVLLKELNQALADGDNIYAVIRGSAVNNDGADKISFTASSVPGQARAMVEAMTLADIDAGEIDYVECHGAGTAIGDPLELGALARAFRTGNDKQGYCAIGSVKSNFGHLEQCAGMAGLIKTALALHRRSIPPSLHFRTQNPKIDFASSPFFVNTERRDWLRNGHARHAAVNSLGLGGTNAFLVLEEGPSRKPAAHEPQSHLFVLSAKAEAALQAAAVRYTAFLDREGDVALPDICMTAATGRSHFSHRFAIVTDTTTQLRDALSKPLRLLRARTHDEPRKLAFLFSGQASQYAGMGTELYRSEPVFRDTIDRCAVLFDAARNESLTEMLFSSRAQSSLDQTINTQPALYAIQAGLVQLWRSWGVTPDAVAGHSIGEFAAAFCARSYGLEDGFSLVLKRAEFMQALPRGGMASIAADADTVAAILKPLDCGSLSIAAINAPQITVISGENAEIERALTQFARQRIGAQTLSVSHAFHSPMMQAAADALREHAAHRSAVRPATTWMSTLTGAPMQDPPDAVYWFEQALRPVRFRDAVVGLVESGISDFVEIGPGTAMLGLGRTSCDRPDLAWYASLRPGNERHAILQSVGALYQHGRDIHWDGFYRDKPGRRVRLPTYPFERHRYWLNQAAGAKKAARNADSLTGDRLHAASHEAIFEASYGLRRIPYLNDHLIYGRPILPLTAGLVALHGASRTYLAADNVVLKGVQYRKAMVVPDSEPTIVQSVVAPLDAGRADCRLASLDGDTWQTHLIARAEQTLHDNAQAPSVDAIRARCPIDIPADDYYAAIRHIGLDYGESFRAITSIRRGDGEVVTRVRLPAHLDLPAFGQHPALLDACLHIYPALAPDFEWPEAGIGHPTYLPIGLASFAMRAAPCREAWVHAIRRDANDAEQTLTIDLTIIADDGGTVAMMTGLTLKRLPETALAGAVENSVDNWLYEVVWSDVRREPLPSQSANPRASWLILADAQGVAQELARLLENRGDAVRLIHPRETDSALNVADPIAPLSAFFSAAIEQSARTYLPPLRAVINLWALDHAKPANTAREIDAVQRLLISGAAGLFRALSETRRHQTASARIWLVTRNAVGTTGDDSAVEPLAASLWGLGRAAALEYPQGWGGLVDLDAQVSHQAAADALLQIILHAHGEDQIALRNGKQLAPRLVRAAAPQAPAHFDPQAQYLITGALGTVGTEVAKWLAVRHKIKHLVLVSRRGNEDRRASALRSELESLGARVDVHKADVANESEMAAVFDAISGLPLKGVFHCAGLLDDGILAQMNWPKFEKVMRPKVAGASLLDRMTRDHPLDHFVVFSSILSLIGSAGQANYAAANAFLDALVDRRRSEGLPALGLNWGPWAADGLATASGDRGRALWRARGTKYIEIEQAWSAFDALIGRADGHRAITITDWPTFVRQFSEIPALYRTLEQDFSAHDRPRRSKLIADIRHRLGAAGADERRNILTDFVRGAVADTLGVTNSIDAARPLREYGLDSLMAITLINDIEAGIGVRLPMTHMIRGPSLEELVDDLVSSFATPSDNAASSVSDPAIVESASSKGFWLTPVNSCAVPKLRLFCFPFAGGGSAVFQNWAPLIRPDVELIAVEPPGRLSRIDEEPVSDIDEFTENVVSEMQGKLDVPFAFFGHCLGGLTLYETARRLIRTTPYRPSHLFVSGARPPDRLAEQGDFERRLMQDLMALTRFRIDLPPHAQRDDVFSEIIRHFNIVATEQLLEQPELRDLMLPIIRAEFRLAHNYIFRAEEPWDVPITCFYAQGDPYVTRSQALAWGRFTNSSFRAHIRTGAHFAVLDDMKFITSTINREFDS